MVRCGVPHIRTICIGHDVRALEAAHAVQVAASVVGWRYNTLEALKAYTSDEVYATVHDIIERLVCSDQPAAKDSPHSAEG